LSFKTKETELATEFAVAGKVISANIITRGPRSLGYCFVELDSEEDAQKAVQLMNKKEINGRPINVEIAKPQDETKERQPREPREPREPRAPKAEGENGARRRPRRRTGRKKEEESEAPASKAENENKEDEDRPRRRPRNRRNRGPGSPGEKRVPNEEKEESKTTLFVANLPFSLDDDGFAKVVTDLNLKLKAAHVVKKRNGRSKGYGFIEFDTQEDQQKALGALNKKVIDSRELSVKVALTEIKREGQAVEEKKESKPADKPAPAEKKAVPAEKKAVPAEKKAAPAEKKAAPAPEKKAAPAPEKKAAPAPEKKPQENKAPAEKKTTAEKKPTPEKKEEKK
jgi:RNA recognition motif-containing protein